jgi:transcriptional regulator with XRE-family HTH domain
MENHNLAFGKALRNFRYQRELTQEVLGLSAGLDRTYISMLELGQRSPTLDTIVAICNALGVDLSSFFSEVEALRKTIQ